MTRLLALCITLTTLAGCGAMNTIPTLRASAPRLDLVIDEPFHDTYRRTVGLFRSCFTSSGWLLDNANNTVHADLFDSAGVAEISQQVATPAWNLYTWSIELNRLPDGKTRARWWPHGSPSAATADWFAGVFRGSVNACVPP